MYFHLHMNWVDGWKCMFYGCIKNQWGRQKRAREDSEMRGGQIVGRTANMYKLNKMWAVS